MFVRADNIPYGSSKDDAQERKWYPPGNFRFFTTLVVPLLKPKKKSWRNRTAFSETCRRPTRNYCSQTQWGEIPPEQTWFRPATTIMRREATDWVHFLAGVRISHSIILRRLGENGFHLHFVEMVKDYLHREIPPVVYPMGHCWDPCCLSCTRRENETCRSSNRYVLRWHRERPDRPYPTEVGNHVNSGQTDDVLHSFQKSKYLTNNYWAT